MLSNTSSSAHPDASLLSKTGTCVSTLMSSKYSIDNGSLFTMLVVLQMVNVGLLQRKQ